MLSKAQLSEGLCRGLNSVTSTRIPTVDRASHVDTEPWVSSLWNLWTAKSLQAGFLGFLYLQATQGFGGSTHAHKDLLLHSSCWSEIICNYSFVYCFTVKYSYARMIHWDYSYDPGAELGASSISRQFTIELLLPRFTLTVSFTKRCVSAHSDKENHV